MPFGDHYTPKRAFYEYEERLIFSRSKAASITGKPILDRFRLDHPPCYS